VVSFTLRPLYPQEKSVQYPLDRRLSGPQSLSGHSGEEKNFQPLPGLKPPSDARVIIEIVSWLLRGNDDKLEEADSLFHSCWYRECFIFLILISIL
jgi:hypothetical protein